MTITIVIITTFLIIIFIGLLIFYPINIYENLYIRNLIKTRLYNNTFFKISIFKSKYEPNNFMLIIYPQEYHFFIENERLIYHPNNKYLDGILSKYICNDNDFELVYNLQFDSHPIIPKVTCHKKLKYLKINIITIQICTLKLLMNCKILSTPL